MSQILYANTYQYLHDEHNSSSLADSTTTAHLRIAEIAAGHFYSLPTQCSRSVDNHREKTAAVRFYHIQINKNKTMDAEDNAMAAAAGGAVAGGDNSWKSSVVTIATISSGFEKGDFLVREEKGMRVYFDFFEEAFNYIANKGYKRMPKEEEDEWMELMKSIHSSVKGGMRYNTGKLQMVLYRPLDQRSGKAPVAEMD